MGSVTLFDYLDCIEGVMEAERVKIHVYPFKSLQEIPGLPAGKQFSTKICSSNLLAWFIGVFFQGVKGTNKQVNEKHENT